MRLDIPTDHGVSKFPQSFLPIVLICYDFEGKQLWHRPLDKMIHIWGNGSSPILYGDLAILWCGPGEMQTVQESPMLS